MKLDIANAFNATSRRAFLNQLFAHASLTPLFRLMHFAYSRESLLIVRSRGGLVVAAIRSQEGFRQGCLAGSFGFALTTHSSLIALSKEFPRVNICAILDDVTLAGSELPVFQVFARLQELIKLNELGLRLNKQKCCVLLGSDGLTPAICAMKWRHRLAHVKGAVELLGTIVGRDALHIEQFVEDKFRSWGPTLELMLSKRMPAQVTLLLARSLGCQRAVYLLRSLPPDLTFTAADFLDDKVKNIVGSKLDLKFNDGFSALMFEAPFRQGGLGFQSLTKMRTSAFLGSARQTLKASTKGTLVRMLPKHTLAQLPTMLHVKSALKTLTPEQLANASLPNPCSFDNFFNKARRDKDSKPPKLQSLLQSVLTETAWSEAHENGSKEQQALLNARLNPYASSALKPAPSLLTEQYRLTDFQVQFLVAHATMQTPGKMPDICACGKALDATHLLCCKQGDSAWLLRHNTLQHSLAGLARVQGLPVEQNVRKSFEDAQLKSKSLEPDAILYFPDKPLWVDLTVVEPVGPSIVGRNLIDVGDAMGAKADLKNAKYQLKARSMDAEFSPLVLETHGRFHADFVTLLKRLAMQLDGYHGLTAREMSVLLNLDLVKGNAAHAAKVKSRVWKAWHKNKQKAGQYSSQAGQQAMQVELPG